MTHVRLPIDPDGTNSAASRPNTAAARSCSRFSVGIFEKHVVADLGFRHRTAHGGRRPGDGIGAQIDREAWSPNDGRGDGCLSRLGRTGGALGDSGELPHHDPRGLIVVALVPPRAALDPPAVLTLVVEQRAAPAAHVVFELYLRVLLHTPFRLRPAGSGSLKKPVFLGLFWLEIRAKRRSYSTAARSAGGRPRRRGPGAPCTGHSALRSAAIP